MPTAITYQSGQRKRDLRTVVVENVRTSVVLLPTGRLEIMTARLLEGTASRHDWWAENLGLPADSYDFAVAADHVVAQRPIQIAVKVKTRKRGELLWPRQPTPHADLSTGHPEEEA